jgi:hypothetical protein
LSSNFDPVALSFGVKTSINNIAGLSVTAFPVFHGAYAPGACMMLIEYVGLGGAEKAILSGDLLCPLVAPDDYHLLRGVRVAYVDANTRFPAPNSGHWSIIENNPQGQDELAAWIGVHSIHELLTPHADLSLLRSGLNLGTDLCWSIKSFVERIEPQMVSLVHYSGYEDGEILDDVRLQRWLPSHVSAATWKIPRPGDEFVLYDGP